jgi:hypothetical protein
MAQEVRVGDVVQTRKSHPCGGDTWQVYRIGADIGLRCLNCGRRVMLSRRDFSKSVRKWISQGAEAAANNANDPQE